MDIVKPGMLSIEAAAALNRLLGIAPQLIPATAYGASLPNWQGGQFTNNAKLNPVFPVLLTAVSGGLYSWSQAIPTGADYAGWKVLVGGNFGTATAGPAYEPNDIAIDVSSPVAAWLQFAYVDPTLGWVYAIVAVGAGTGGTTPTLEITDGTTTVTNVTEIDFTAGGKVTNLGGGIAGVVAGATLTVQSASGSLSSAVGTNTICSLTLSAGGLAIIVGNTDAATPAAQGGINLSINLHGGAVLATQTGYSDVTGFTTYPFCSVTWIGTVTGGQQIDLNVGASGSGTITGVWNLRSLIIS